MAVSSLEKQTSSNEAPKVIKTPEEIKQQAVS
jgi:hypothetical protein